MVLLEGKSLVRFEYEENLPVTLAAALQQYDISLTQEQCAKVEQYCHLLWDWNSKLNLTRHLDYDTFVSRDVLDSVELAELLNSKEKVLDVGSGGGVPGILLAILRPDVFITVSDSIEKKTRALEDMVKQLDLPTRVVNSRVQDLFPNRRFDTLVARAVGPMAKILRWLQPHWRSFDRVLLIKGPRWTEERKEARHRGLLSDIELRRLKSYPMPGTDSESVIVSLHKEQQTA